MNSKASDVSEGLKPDPNCQNCGGTGRREITAGSSRYIDRYISVPCGCRTTPSPTLDVERLRIEGSIYEGFEASIADDGGTVAHVRRYGDAVRIVAALATLSPPLPSLEVERRAEELFNLVYAHTVIKYDPKAGIRACVAALSALPLDGGLSSD